MTEKFREGNVRGENGRRIKTNDGSSKKVIASQRPAPPPAPKPKTS